VFGADTAKGPLPSFLAAAEADKNNGCDDGQ